MISRVTKSIVFSLGLILLGISTNAADVHPAVWRDLETRDDVLLWVFFVDKEVTDVDAAVRDLESSYASRAIERRRLRRTRPGLFDQQDIPVSPRYTAVVRMHVDRVRVASKWLNAVSVEATRAQVEALAELPFVSHIQPVRRGAPIDLMGPDETGSGVDGGFYGLAHDQLETINLPLLHDAGFTGEGVIVGVLDTGFKRTHDVFHFEGHELNVIAEYDFVNDDANTAPESGDDPGQHWHGSIILSTLAAYLPNTFVGAAYDASYILCKTEDVTAEYQAEEDFYVAGLEFIEANGGDVATSSLGYIDWYTQDDLDGMTAVTTVGVNTATANGLHCCTAAGNGGHDQNPNTSHLIAPADAFEVITVGAVNIFGEEAGFSSDGPTADGRVKPEILAVGEVAAGIDPNNDSGYLEASGTSMSTPMLAGMVACLTEAGPHWTVERQRQAIMLTGSDYLLNGQPDPTFVRGYGIANAFAAWIEGGARDAEISDLAVITGTILGGGVGQLSSSDDQYLHTRSGFGSSLIDLHKLELTIDAVTDVIEPGMLTVTIESRLNEAGGLARVRLLNHATGDFDVVGQYNLSTSDAVEVIANIPAAPYVDGKGQLAVEVRHTVFVPFLAHIFESWMDWVNIRAD